MSTVLIGVASGDRGDAATRLGALIARSSGSAVILAAIVPLPWPPRPHLGEEEFDAALHQIGEAALDRARGVIDADDLQVEYRLERANSVAAGLLELSERSAADLVVLGSGRSGLPGRVSLGSIAQRILHSLEVSVCFAPNGYVVAPGARISRVTVGFGRGDADSGLLTAAVERARRYEVPLRVACFAVRPSTVARGSIEPAADELVVAQWQDQLRTEILAAASLAGADLDALEIVVGSGTSWEEAISAVGWTPTDLLAVGAKTSAISRFLLGSHAAKIVKHSPVPVLAVARGSR